MIRAEFMANEELVKSWRNELATNELLKIVLGICEDESPLNQSVDNTSETAANIALGKIVGYNLYSVNLRTLAVLPQIVDDPTKKPSTYNSR